jgi:hypothetical protein
MHHLVQHRVLHLRPGMPGEMPPAQADFIGPASLEIDRELAETAAHPAGDPDRNLAQSSAEVLRVQLTMEALQAMEEQDISGTGSLGTRRSLRRGRVGLHRKFEKLSFCGSPERSTHPGIQEPNDCLEHTIGSEGVTPMYAQDPLAKAEHHRLVRVGEDTLDIP